MIFVLFSLLGLTSGIGGLLVFAGLYLTGTALWTLLSGRSWLGRTGRPRSLPIFAAGLALTVVGSTVDPVEDVEPTGTAVTSPSATAPTPSTSTPPP